MLFFYRIGLLMVMAVLLLITPSENVINFPPEDELINLPELSLPLTNKKLVIAHNMTNIIRYKGHRFESSCDPRYYAPTGNITASIGGLTQVNVLSDTYLADKSLDEAVEFEMKAAIRAGIDGFQFYYTLGNDEWDDIIKAYFRVATKKNINFKFTFCISHPSGGTETSRISSFAKRMNSILHEAGRQNPHWLRTPDGRLIIYTWYGNSLADIPADLKDKSAAYYVASAFSKLALAVGEKFAPLMLINEKITDDSLNRLLDYFPGVWLWTLPYTHEYIGEKVAAICKARNRNFTGSAFPDFYTSKLLKKGTWNMYHFAEDAVKAGMENAERKYIVTGLSYNFRKQLEFAINEDVQLINIITWNDYPEGHHLAPEANHNDGFSLLLQHYKAIWKKGPSPFDNEDILIAFYKKYRHDLKPSPYYFPVIAIEKAGIPEVSEDSLEIITMLKKKGELMYKKQSVLVGSGFQSTKFQAVSGSVEVIYKRDGKPVLKLVCPEWITEKPFRTDRLTYTFSNKTLTTLKEDFAGSIPSFSPQYNPGVAGNAVKLNLHSK